MKTTYLYIIGIVRCCIG